jgi:hypothetical protein
MFERFHKHVGTAGLVVAIVALIAALGGGAYAATGGNSGTSGTKATASAKQGKPGKPGKAGPAGPAGAAGPAGPQGPAGAKGDTGAAGANGTSGTDGTNGVSVTTSAATSVECPSGGIKVASASPTVEVCNGTTGFTETLPSQKTETGTWATGWGGNETLQQFVSIPFTLPVEPSPELTFAWMTEGPSPTVFEGEELKELLEEAAENGCPGFDEGVPLADPGHLCVYANFMEHMTPTGTGLTPTIRPAGQAKQIYTGVGLITPPSGFPTEGVSPVGTTLDLNCIARDCRALGTWAVTAE